MMVTRVVLFLAASMLACSSGTAPRRPASCDSPAQCNDGVSCTTDTCDGGQCRHLPDVSRCTDDGIFCNGAETCDPSQAGHDPVTGCVSSGDPCAGGPECNDACNEGGDTCFAAMGMPCADTIQGDCLAAACDGAGLCDAQFGPEADGLPCDDALFCNGSDTCTAGSCSVHAGDPCLGGGECNAACNEDDETCFDPPGSLCTDTTPANCYAAGCDGAGLCVQQYYTALDRSPCNDGVFCNGADLCDSAGACSEHVGDPCLAGGDCNRTCNEAGRNCFDPPGTPCTEADLQQDCHTAGCDGAGLCDQQYGVEPDGTYCQDAVFCNGADSCDSAGSCSTHAGNPCAPDICSEAGPACGGLPTFVTMVSGHFHTCALAAGGAPYCWGWDLYGQLGNGGGSVDANSPSGVDTSPIPGNRAFTQLAAGTAHTCGLTADGVAYCWGWDLYGQLGNGGASQPTQSPTPVSTASIPGNKAFVQLTAGAGHSCGLTGDGVAYCWGWDGYGQLGTGGASADAQAPSPVDTSTLAGVKAFIHLAAGARHTCGITVEGLVYCWGNNNSGQLGNGTLGSTQSPSLVDTSTVTGNRGFIRLTAGFAHTCGVAADGVSYCWGDDQYGQIGNGSAVGGTARPSPIDTSGVVGNQAWARLAAGESHTCGLTVEGVAYCWGFDAYGQLGDGSGLQDITSPSPVDIATLTANTAFVQLAVGAYQACGLTADGLAYCWGSDVYGQLGNGGASLDAPSPSTVNTSALPSPVAFLDVATGGSHACGLVLGGLAYCWGRDSAGQLGNGSALTNVQRPSPVDTSTLAGNRAFAHLPTGQDHTCALTAVGKAFCWGANQRGQLGTGGTEPYAPSPAAVSTLTVTGNTTFSQLAAGSSHTCAVTATGAVYCWGDDAVGQLGNGSVLAGSSSPSPVDTSAIAGNRAFVHITAGPEHTCGLTAGGAAYCWGSDSSGQLGNGGTSQNSESPVALDMSTVAGSARFVTLVAGGNHTCGLTTSGVAYCWGWDFYGQLGNGAGTSSQSPTAVDTSTVAGGVPFAQLAAGSEHTCARAMSGAVYCWGRDSFGQLGNGGTSQDAQSPSLVDTTAIAGNTAFLGLRAASQYTCGLTVERVAYCWGRDSFGQLGNGGTSQDTQSPSPVDISAM